MRIFVLTAISSLFAVTSLHADVILFEDFEDATITYTTSVADNLTGIASENYFGRIASDTASLPGVVSYSNGQGDGFYGVQDTDDTTSGNIDLITLEWNGIDISNFENLNLSWFVAEDDATDGLEDWDTTSSVRLEVQIDGGAFQDVFAIESEIGSDGNQTNEVPRVDTDFNGVGDGTEITDMFAQFSSGIANGSVLNIRLTIEDLETGDEDVAFDSLLLEGDAVVTIPEPASLTWVMLGACGLTVLRRRRK